MRPVNCKKTQGIASQHLFSVKWNSVLIYEVIKYSKISEIQQFFVSSLNTTWITSLFGAILLHFFWMWNDFFHLKMSVFEIWVTQSMALPEPFPWMSQNISAFLGCYSHVFYWCWMYAGFESLHCTTCNCGQFCAAGGGMCCSISSCSTCAITPAYCWTWW